MQEKRYTIRELQSLTNTNRRTIHFYTQRGLLPRPDSRGSSASYPEDALTRLQLIKELHKRRFTLDEIKNIFEKDYEGLKVKLLISPVSESFREHEQKVKSKEDLSDYLISNFGSAAGRLSSFTSKNYSSAGKASEPTSRSLEEETVRRIRLAEGIELNITDVTYRRYGRAIKKGISEFQKLLSEEGVGK